MFAIWGVIFLWGAGFAVWHGLPTNLADPTLRTLGWLAAAAFALNAIWEWHVPKREIDALSLLIIGLELLVLLAALAVVDASDMKTGARFWLAAAPLQLLAGWISAAAFVNLGSTLKRNGVRIGRTLNVAILLGAGVLAVAVAHASHSPVYAAAVCWALIGVVLNNLLRDRDIAVGATAGILVPIVMGAALIGP